MALLVVAAGLQMVMPSSASLPDRPVMPPRRVAAADAPLARSYPAVLARPIFAPDRAPVILSAPTGGSLSGFEVLGTAIAGNVSAALVRGPMGRVLRVKPDETLLGWRLVSIERTQLTFDRDGERRTLAVTAATPRPGAANPQLATSHASNSDDDDDDSNSNSGNNSNDDDDDN
jgi:hypothetical protein